MEIQRTAEDEYCMTLSPGEARMFINCMRETLNEIGDWEYPTRMGASAEQIKGVISALASALD